MEARKRFPAIGFPPIGFPPIGFPPIGFPPIGFCAALPPADVLHASME
jgi:hypothetical protein